MGGGILEGGNQIFQCSELRSCCRCCLQQHTWGQVWFVWMLHSDTAVAVGIIPYPAKFLYSLGLGTVRESYSGMHQPRQTETAPDHDHHDCSGSLLNFCHEGEVAENLCNFLTSPNRCRTAFSKYMSWNQSQEQFLLISEMTELSSAGCRCRSLAGVWV